MLWVMPFLIAAVLLESVALPGVSGARFRIDAALVIVVGWATIRGWEEGLLAGLIAGLTADFLSAAPFGLQMARLGTVGVLAGVLMPRLARSSPVFPIVAAAAGSLVAFFVGVLGLQAAGWAVSWEQTLLQEVIPSALLAGACMAVAFPLIRALVRRTLTPAEDAVP